MMITIVYLCNLYLKHCENDNVLNSGISFLWTEIREEAKMRGKQKNTYVKCFTKNRGYGRNRTLCNKRK